MQNISFSSTSLSSNHNYDYEHCSSSDNTDKNTTNISKRLTSSVAVLMRSDLLVIAWLGVMSGISFGILLPTLKPFTTESASSASPPGLGQSSTFYALTIAVFSVGEFIGSNVAGIAIRRGGENARVKDVFTAMNVIGIVGSLLYVLTKAEYAYLLIIGRLLTGLWSGGINVAIRTHMNATIAKDDLMFAMAGIGFVITLAMMLSPGLQSIFSSSLPTSIDNNDQSTSWMVLDEYHYPAWFVFCLLVVSFVLVLVAFPRTFKENDENESQTQSLLSSVEQREAKPMLEVEQNTSANNNNRLWDSDGVPDAIVILLLVIFALFSFGFTVVESMATPLMNDMVGIDIEASSILFAIAGVVSAVSFLILLVADKAAYITDTQATLVALILLVIGSIVFTDFQSIANDDSCQQYTCSYNSLSDTDTYCSEYPEYNVTQLQSFCQSTPHCTWNAEDCTICPPICHDPKKTLSLPQIYIGFVLFNVQYVLGRICCAAIYSKLMPRKKSAWMQSLLMSSATVSRAIAPLIAIALYDVVDYHSYGLTLFVFVLSLVCLVGYCLKMKEIETLLLR